MCLLSTTVKPKKAKEDIICYKFLMKGDCLKSPWREFIWELNKEYTAERSKPRYSKKSITDGYFHTYKSHMEARVDADYHQCSRFWYGFPLNVCIYKCIIPKGSVYFEGICNGGFEGYASKKLIVVEAI